MYHLIWIGNISPAAFKIAVVQQESECFPGPALKYCCKMLTSPTRVGPSASLWCG